MRHRTVGDLMTTSVVKVRRDTGFKEIAKLLVRTLGVTPGAITVRVVGGRVSLKGTVEHKSLVPVVVRLCQGVDGVVDVSAELNHRLDDTSAAPDPEASRRAGLAT